MTPLDDNFSASETGNSNIYTNKGTCQYYIYATEANKSPVLIKIFQLNSSILTSEERYETDFSATGVSLKMGTDDYLYYEDGSTIYHSFTINAEPGTGTIRPGDDLRLRIGVVYYPEFKATVAAGDFLACYNKKLLWRANLYINEGAGDWNTVNPWTATQGNEWDTRGDGRQITFNAWTTANNNAEITEAVAYAHGCCDSPFNFLSDLNDQRDYIQNYYSNDNPIWTEENQNPHPEWAGWDQTIAPEDDWDNYLISSYVPNLTEYLRRKNGGYTIAHRRHSAGVDCVSFVRRSANYGGLAVGYPNTIDDMDRDIINSSPFIDNYLTVEIHANSTRIYEYNVDDASLLNLIVPGDYVQIDGHAALVNRVVFTNGRVTNRQNVKIIEATTFNNKWWIQNSQFLSDYSNDFIAIWRFNQN